MVEQYAGATPRARPEVGEYVGKIVCALEHLDDHAFNPQIVAPDLLDELGVVFALNEDAAGHGDPGALGGGRKRSGSSALTTAWLALRHHKADGFAVNEKAIAERERTHLATEILELNESFAGAHDGATPFGLAVLHDEIAGKRDLAPLNRASPRLHFCQRIVVIPSIEHDSSVSAAHLIAFSGGT
ncbi:hypothetical protein EDF62_1061 [Leucobacter luti]|uniref:Uncharacterized protein n=1 Tax=Leucobacter luti TaxID=340320 RepID=A0A4R6S4M8_9MICO|nr:hypothetical protein EDF62_1061 [Leucobacter luti]